MPSDADIERFISDSFTSIWDLELLSVIVEEPDSHLTAAELVQRMRASELVVEQGIRTLVAVGLASTDKSGGLIFKPVSADLAEDARKACDFYRRFPGRARRLMISRQSPGLSAFADAFRIRKDEP